MGSVARDIEPNNPAKDGDASLVGIGMIRTDTLHQTALIFVPSPTQISPFHKEKSGY